MARRGGRVVGCDLSPGMLRHALRRARSAGLADRADWVRMDARRIACRDASFPLVVCAMSLHEMAEEEIRQVLAEVRRVSSDKVVVADYQLPSAGWRRLLFWFFKVFERLESEDFDGFISKGLRERLEAAGLAVEAYWDTGLYRVCTCSVSGSPDS
jgi:ubiquinone/menaquinone biosynthesis C-methylase UbiE